MEDGIIVTDDFVAIIDGSTSKSPVRIVPGMTNGRYCMLLIKEYICHAESQFTTNDFCNGLTAFIREKYDGLDTQRLAKHPEERLTASCIVYSRARRQIWMIGDCQCLVDGHLYENPKPYETQLAAKRSAIAQELISSGKYTVDELRTDDVARKAIIPELIETMAGQNKSYAVVDGFDIPMDKVRVITLDAQPHTIVLASDGYPHLRPTLAESEAELHRQLHSDPLNIRTFKATKAYARGNNSFDDRSYIRFTI